MPRAGLSTDRVVRAGADLADEVGFQAVTVAAVARTFDVRTASLYSHVAGTDDLRARIARLALDELADRAAEAVAGRAGTEALVAFADVYRAYAHEHPGRYAATRAPLAPDSPGVEAGRRHTALMRAVLRGYDLDETDQVHAVRLLGSVLHGFTSLELSGSFAHSAPPSEASWRIVVESLDGLLRRWPRR